MIHCSCFVAIAMTVLKVYIGMVKVSSCCINGLRMVAFVGHVIETMLIS